MVPTPINPYICWRELIKCMIWFHYNLPFKLIYLIVIYKYICWQLETKFKSELNGGILAEREEPLRCLIKFSSPHLLEALKSLAPAGKSLHYELEEVTALCWLLSSELSHGSRLLSHHAVVCIFCSAEWGSMIHPLIFTIFKLTLVPLIIFIFFFFFF